jgi:hypothetical protein
MSVAVETRMDSSSSTIAMRALFVIAEFIGFWFQSPEPEVRRDSDCELRVQR